MKLNINEWKTFEFGRLIDEIYKARACIKVELTTSSDKRNGFIPFVSRTEANNGVDCYVLASDVEDAEDGNAIVIGDTTLRFRISPHLLRQVTI